MSSKVSVTDLSWNTTEDTLREAFSPYGSIVDLTIVRDRDTGN